MDDIRPGSRSDSPDRGTPRLTPRGVARARPARLDYRALFEGIDEGFCVLDVVFDDRGRPVDYVFVEVNPAFGRLTGLRDVVGRRKRELVPDIESSWARVFGTVARTGRPVRFVHRAMPLRGRWFSLYAFAAGPPPERVAVLFTDVTAQRLAEERLRESEARFRAAAETIPDILFTVGPRGHVDYVSPRFTELTGVPAEALCARRGPLGLVHPADRRAAVAARAAAGRIGAPLEVRLRLRTASGGYSWHLVRARPMRDPSGHVERWFGVCIQVDRLVEAEEAVRAHNAALEERVQQRRAQVEALSRALALAEQQERARLAHVLHDDLQQLLVGAMLRLAAGREGVEAARDLLEQAIALTRTLSAELVPPGAQEDGLEAVLRWLAARCEQLHGLRVELDLAAEGAVPDPAYVTLVYRIAREFLLNVVKHAGTREARLGAWLREDHLELLVEDAGRGIAAGGGDQGFGLRHIRERLALIGGSLTIEPRAEGGTCARVRIPLVAPPA